MTWSHSSAQAALRQCWQPLGRSLARTPPLHTADQCAPSVERLHAFFDQVHFTAGGYFGMEQGAMCALGYATVLGWPPSACVVSQTTMNSRRSARNVPASSFKPLGG